MAFQPQPFGKYYLLEKVAMGGMAEIFKAKTFGVVGFEKLLAIKRILPNLSQDSDFIKMLVDEAKIAVQLNHMNIVQVYDLGKIDKDYFIAMEFIDGKDLRTIMRRCEDLKERISVENAVFIVVEICKGLDYAHRKKDQFGLPSGIVHRDISPQNILISFEGEVKIVDFGIAKAKSKATETDAGVLKGKFAYMSPEQARGEEVDQRTDIYSTGIILYELLTGERLFYTDNNIKTLEKIKNFHIEPPFLPSDIPSELEYILMQALEPDPIQRYQNANEFQVDLTKFLYSSALDFTSKNLADLMEKNFSADIEQKEELRDRDDDIELDTETRLMIQEANQEVLVSREEDMTPSQLASKLATHQRKLPFQPKGIAPSPADLFEEPSGKKWAKRAVLGLLILIFTFGALYFGDKIIGFYKTIEQSAQINKDEPSTKEKVVQTGEKLGSVYVETIPAGARIFLDKVEIKNLTPTLIKDVVPRTSHDLLITLQNYKRLQKTVKIEPGEIFRMEVKLEREIGKIFIGSTPSEASVFLNDASKGKTPIELIGIAANVDLAVRIKKKGFREYFEVIRVQPDQTKILQARLVKEEGDLGSVRIQSVPTGAKIILDGVERKAKTPATIDRLDVNRSHFLVLQLKGYQEYSSSFRVNESKIKTMKTYLKTVPEEIP